ncbi:MAG TPA: PRC-barrel domain-containing protein, partial [Actinopolymorphaceae bacterium]
MSTVRVFVGRLAGTPVYDPAGDLVGKVRDVVAGLRTPPLPPRVIGLVLEIPGRRRVFLPMTRVTSIEPGQVIVTGLVNVRRFRRRPTETLVIAEMLDREVTISATGEPATVFDVAMEQSRTRDWELSKVAVLTGT